MFSLLSKIDQNAVYKVGPKSLEIGSRVRTKGGKYSIAALHQKGTTHMPERPPLLLNEAAKRRIIKLVQTETLKRAGGAQRGGRQIDLFSPFKSYT